MLAFRFVMGIRSALSYPTGARCKSKLCGRWLLARYSCFRYLCRDHRQKTWQDPGQSENAVHSILPRCPRSEDVSTLPMIRMVNCYHRLRDAARRYDGSVSVWSGFASLWRSVTARYRKHELPGQSHRRTTSITIPALRWGYDSATADPINETEGQHERPQEAQGT